MASENLNIDITAKDQASKVIDPITKKVQALEKEDVEIPISADAKGATRDIDTFIKKLDGLKDRDAAILIAAKVAPAQAALADLLVDISQLDASDPTIDIKMSQVAEITGDLEKLDTKLQSLDTKTVSPKVDTSGIDHATKSAESSAETFQRGVGPLRGFTDELGGAAGAAGTMGNAFIDGGEAVQVFGAKLGLSEGVLTKLAGGFAIAGAAVAVGMVAYQAFTRQQEETAKKTKEASERLLEQSGILEKLKDSLDPTASAYDAFASALDAGDFKRATVALGKLDLEVGDLGTTLEGIREPGNAFLEQTLKNAGVTDKYAGMLAKAINEGDSYKDVINNVASALEDQGMDSFDAQEAAVALTAQYRTQIDALEELNDQAENNDLEKIAQDQIDAARAAGGHTEELLKEAEAAVTSGSAIDVYNKFLETASAEALAASQAQAELTAGMEANAAAAAIAASNQEAAAALIEGVNTKLEEQATAWENDAAAAKALSDQLSGQVDAMGAAVESQEAANNSLIKFAEVAKDAKTNGKDVADAAWDMSKATADNAEKQAEANGQILTASEKLDAQNTSLLNAAASTKKGRGETLDYIFALNKIPPDKQTEIRTLLDQGKVDEAKAKIDEASVARDVALNADANARQAEIDLDNAAADRNTKITATANTTPADVALNALYAKYRTLDVVVRGPGGVSRGEHGGFFPEGGIAGEAGPEFIKKPGKAVELIDGAQFIPPRTRVTSAVKTRQILKRRKPKRFANGTQMPALVDTGGHTFQFIQQAPIYGVQDLDRHLEKWSNRLAQKISVGKR